MIPPPSPMSPLSAPAASPNTTNARIPCIGTPPHNGTMLHMRRGLPIAAILLIAGGALAQRFGFQREDEGPRPTFPKQGEFHFVRLEYTDLPEYHRSFRFASRRAEGDGWWVVDWPDSDEHFTMGVQRLTRVDIGEPEHFGLKDDRLWDHPFLYATQTGYWGLSPTEIARLREYLLRGGF